MADENAILVAMGLDTAEFDKGINKSQQVVQGFVQVGNDLDEYIRKIPIVGTLWEATGGKIVDAFAKIREDARTTRDLMELTPERTVSGSLDYLDKLNAHLKELKSFSLTRSIGDFLSAVPRGVDPVDQLLHRANQRTADAAKIEKRRDELLEKLPKRIEEQEKAENAAYSQSLKQSEILKVQLATRQKINAAEETARKLSGPNAGVEQVEERKNALIKAYNESQEASIEAINKRYIAEMSVLSVQQKQAEAANRGLATPQRVAGDAVREARIQLNAAATKEDKEAATYKLNTALAQYGVAVKETKLLEANAALAKDEAKIKLEGYNVAVKTAEAQVDAAQKSLDALKQQPDSSLEKQNAQAKLQDAKAGLVIAQENRFEWEKALELSQLAAQSRDSASRIALADAQREVQAAQDRIANLAKITESEKQLADDKAQAQEKLESAQHKLWDASIAAAQEELSIRKNIIAASTGIGVNDQSRSFAGNTAAAQRYLNSLPANADPARLSEALANLKAAQNAQQEFELNRTSQVVQSGNQAATAVQSVNGATPDERFKQSLRNKYEVPFIQAHARGDSQLEGDIQAEAQADINGYEIGQRTEGAQARAAERQAARTQARRLREQQAIDREKQRAAEARKGPGLSPESLLDKKTVVPKPITSKEGTAPKDNGIKIDGFDQFQQKILEILKGANK